MTNLTNYLTEYFGTVTKISPLENDRKASLPLFLRGNYELYQGSIMGHQLIWAKVKPAADLPAGQLLQQQKLLQRTLQSPVVFVFDRIESWERKRMIERKIAFAQPFKQLYIPQLLLQLNEPARSPRDPQPPKENLTAPAQFAILFHLQVQPLEHITFQDIAIKLQYSPMTVSRIVQELQEYELLEVTTGREKSFRFNSAGRDLWQKTKPYLKSPVRETWFTGQALDHSNFQLSGDSALGSYTMLAENNQWTYAIGKDEFRVLKQTGHLMSLNEKFGDNKLEVWHYNPKLLSLEKRVDRLSLFLTMQHEEDERVKGALDQLINTIPW